MSNDLSSQYYCITMDEDRVIEFIEFASHLKGYEKGEAQLFLDHLFIAFGQKGVMEAGASLETQIIIETKTKFCDLLWPGIVLFEMKSKDQNLANHFIQAKTYWDNTYGNRPKYVVLCNFDEFWIYNWNLQRDPLDKVPLLKLHQMWRSLAFLCPEPIKPIFGNNLVEVTEEAADKIAQLYASLVHRGIDRSIARRYALQCLVCLFAEDTGLFPDNTIFSTLIDECKNGQSTYDLFTLLFKQMNSEAEAVGGKFKGVRYFNGGVFSKITPLELNASELNLLCDASKFDWSKIQPSIFGTIFEDSLEDAERHMTGAHFTFESGIMAIVEPTILRPWREKIVRAKTLKELNDIREELSRFKVLDPACGSGNFLYLSYRELRFLEIQLFQKMIEKFPSVVPHSLHSSITCAQFFGIDTNPLAIELAKITLSMAKILAAQELKKFTKQHRFMDEADDPLPFDNLENNFTVGDALFIEWPKVDAIIGNPPYQSKNKMQEEFGAAYLDRLHHQYPEISGFADYCVYWFRKAHDNLILNGRAGLVGTNTIRQTYSRESGLDYIVANNGIIMEAISSMPWRGKAVVHVSIVNWIKSIQPSSEIKKLREQLGEKGDEPWQEFELVTIPSSLSPLFDVTKAISLMVNRESESCYQGQTHGHEAFLLDLNTRAQLLKLDPSIADVTFPYLIADELISSPDSQPRRYVIDFGERNIFSSKKYELVFKIIQAKVLSDRQEAFEREKKRNIEALASNPSARVNHHHEHFLQRWWQLSYRRTELIKKLDTIPRYIVCSRVTRRPIFEFISSKIRPNDSLVAFPLADDYSFGVLQSVHHWEWFKARCSTLKDDFRYTSNTVFDSFPWPQWGFEVEDTKKEKAIQIVKEVAIASKELRKIRNELKIAGNLSHRDLYRTLELPGANPLRDAHERLDLAVSSAYGFGLPSNDASKSELEILYLLNSKCSEAEKLGKTIQRPGLPSFCQGLLSPENGDNVEIKQ